MDLFVFLVGDDSVFYYYGIDIDDYDVIVFFVVDGNIDMYVFIIDV